MNSKRKTILLIAIFVILMIGTSVLYNNLSSSSDVGGLVTDNVSNLAEDSSSDETSTTEQSSETDQTSEDTKNEETSSSQELKKAPDIKVFDKDGNEVLLSSYFGKPIILNFWASWCGPCKQEMPDFDEAYNTYGDEIQFLMVNMTDGSRETVESASSFIEDEGYSFPILFDSEYNASITYSVTSIPTTYFIDSEGYLTAHAMGAIDSALLQQGIDMITVK